MSFLPPDNGNTGSKNEQTLGLFKKKKKTTGAQLPLVTIDIMFPWQLQIHLIHHYINMFDKSKRIKNLEFTNVFYNSFKSEQPNKAHISFFNQHVRQRC